MGGMERGGGMMGRGFWSSPPDWYWRSLFSKLGPSVAVTVWPGNPELTLGRLGYLTELMLEWRDWGDRLDDDGVGEWPDENDTALDGGVMTGVSVDDTADPRGDET